MFMHSTTVATCNDQEGDDDHMVRVSVCNFMGERKLTIYKIHFKRRIIVNIVCLLTY